MKKALASAILGVGVLLSPLARAEWSVFGDLERFRWSEDTVPSVTETGAVLGLGVRWTQDRDRGWRWGYRGRLYGGSADYQGSFLGTDVPVSGTTEYGGLSNEVRLGYRFSGRPYGLEFVSGLILDYWNRQLSPDQREQYWIGALRIGLQLERREPHTFFGEAGVKLPFWTREDAHLTDIGFNANPRLEPEGEASVYAELGYRFDRAFSVSAYYDGYRFRESAPTPLLVNPFVSGCEAPGGCSLVQPTSRLDSVGLRAQYRF